MGLSYQDVFLLCFIQFFIQSSAKCNNLNLLPTLTWCYNVIPYWPCTSELFCDAYAADVLWSKECRKPIILNQNHVYLPKLNSPIHIHNGWIFFHVKESAFSEIPVSYVYFTIKDSRGILYRRKRFIAKLLYNQTVKFRIGYIIPGDYSLDISAHENLTMASPEYILQSQRIRIDQCTQLDDQILEPSINKAFKFGETVQVKIKATNPLLKCININTCYIFISVSGTPYSKLRMQPDNKGASSIELTNMNPGTHSMVLKIQCDQNFLVFSYRRFIIDIYPQSFHVDNTLVAEAHPDNTTYQRWFKYLKLILRKERKIRLGLFGLSLEVGGMQLQYLLQAKWLSTEYSSYFNVSYISLERTGPLLQKLSQSNIVITHIAIDKSKIGHYLKILRKMKTPKSIFLPQELQAILKVIKLFDIISVPNTGVGYEIVLLELARIVDTSVRVLELPNRNLHADFIAANLIIGPSHYAFSDSTTLALCSMNGINCSIIHPSVDTNIWNSNIINHPYRYQKSTVSITIGYVARFGIKRSHGLFLKIAKGLINLSISGLLKIGNKPLLLKFILIGEGYLFEDIKSLAKKLAIERHISFKGELFGQRLQFEVQKMSMVLNTAVIETFGISTIEAMNSGKPVVACSQTAAREIIVDKITGLLIDCSDYKKAITQIAKCIQNTTLLDKIGSNARLKIQNRLHTQNFAELYAQSYIDKWLHNQPH